MRKTLLVLTAMLVLISSVGLTEETKPDCSLPYLLDCITGIVQDDQSHMSLWFENEDLTGFRIKSDSFQVTGYAVTQTGLITDVDFIYTDLASDTTQQAYIALMFALSEAPDIEAFQQVYMNTSEQQKRFEGYFSNQGNFNNYHKTVELLGNDYNYCHYARVGNMDISPEAALNLSEIVKEYQLQQAN